MVRESGEYWNLKSGGVEQSIYNRLPFGIAMPLGMIAGGLYIVALPLIIVATSVYVVGLKIAGALLNPVRKSVSFGWRPTEAYLAGKNKKEKKGNNPS